MNACAKQHRLSRQDWLQISNREYSGVTQEEILLSAEQLFTLADGDDFHFVHTDDGIYATRNWMVYVVFGMASGTDYWLIKTTPTSKGIKVSIQVNRQAQVMVPVVTTGGDMSATSTPMAGAPVDGTAIYDLFWTRMDYLLGKRKEWMSCKEADARVSKGIVWGLNEPLCLSLNTKDDTPTSPFVSHR